MKKETKELTVTNSRQVQRGAGLLLDAAAFEHAQRVAQVFTKSTMVPDHFRGNIGNCIIALNYASRTGVDPFMVMQKMYIIHGKPAIETQLQIALFNSSGKFTPLKYKLSGAGDNQQCIAYATEKSSGEEIEGPVVSIEMAKKEGWYQKKGSKWQTLPELMLRYRSAAFFIRLYSPETTLGLMTSDEVEDIHVAVNHEPEENSKMIDIEVESKPVPEKKTTPKKSVAKKTEKVDTEAKEEDPYN